MYLISDSTPPVMYELYASSKEDRRTWMSRIQQAAVRSEPLRGAPSDAPQRTEPAVTHTEMFLLQLPVQRRVPPHRDGAQGSAQETQRCGAWSCDPQHAVSRAPSPSSRDLLSSSPADILQKDREVKELLQERATLFSDWVEAAGRGGENDGGVELSTSSTKNTSSCRNLFRADTPHALQGAPLLTTCIAEGDFFFPSSSCVLSIRLPIRPSIRPLVSIYRLDAESPVSPVDRLTELLLNSSGHKSAVTNGNQELSSE